MHPKRTRLVLAICWCLAVPYARAAESTDPEALQRQYQELQHRYNTASQQYSQARELVLRQDDLATLATRMSESREARDRKVQASPQVAAAQKAHAEAYAAYLQMIEAQIAADPNASTIQKQLQQLDDQIEELDSQQRITNFMLTEVQRRCARKPEIRKLYAVVEKADSALYEAQRRDPNIQATYKAYNDASSLLLTKPEMDALRKAYEDAQKNSPLVAEAQKAREAARAEYDQAIASVVAAHPDTAALKKKLDDIASKLPPLQEARRNAAARLQEIRQRLNNSDVKIAQSRKAYYAADTAMRQTMTDAAPNESAACQELEQEYGELSQTRLAADPNVSALRVQVDELTKQMQELGLRVKRAEGQPRPNRRRPPRG